MTIAELQSGHSPSLVASILSSVAMHLVVMSTSGMHYFQFVLEGRELCISQIFIL